MTGREYILQIKREKFLNMFSEHASDALASRVPQAYRGLKGDGRLVKGGTRINYKGQLYRARVDLWDRADSTPDTAPNLWEKILYKDGIRIIPETITAEYPFNKGERGWWQGRLYESTLEVVNTYTPDQYPDGWKLIKEAKA